jgi:hypothetical protein
MKRVGGGYRQVEEIIACNNLVGNLMSIGACIVVINEEEEEEEGGEEEPTRCYLVLGSTSFGQHYANHQEITTISLITTWTA